jgi:hypothetical protein
MRTESLIAPAIFGVIAVIATAFVRPPRGILAAQSPSWTGRHALPRAAHPGLSNAYGSWVSSRLPQKALAQTRALQERGRSGHRVTPALCHGRAMS